MYLIRLFMKPKLFVIKITEFAKLYIKINIEIVIKIIIIYSTRSRKFTEINIR